MPFESEIYGLQVITCYNSLRQKSKRANVLALLLTKDSRDGLYEAFKERS